MQAVLMAGGSGTRLRPLTCDLPKPMVPVLNRPVAEHILNLLKRHEIREAILTLHYLPDVVQAYFGDGSAFDMQITYAVEEDRPLGTAGCVRGVSELLDDTFVAISGDSIADFDLTAALHFHRSKGSKATLILARVPNPAEFGVVILGRDGRIQRFLEKPTSSEVFSDTVNTGTYILEPEVLDYLPTNKDADFSQDLFPMLLSRGEPMYGYVAEGYWCDIGHLDTYREAQYDALRGRVRLDWAYRETAPGIWIGSNTSIDPTARIEAPILIGHNCRIGPRATLEAGTVIGDNVTIGAEADLRRPVVWNGAIVGDQAQVWGCAIARGARVDRRATIREGAVLGSLCTVEEEAQVSPEVRVWPHKKVESGAILNANLIWGNVAQRNLFSQQGVTGTANIDITPEFAVKLGVAYGSTLQTNSQVVVSRDQRNISRTIARALIAGLMSAGINVQNLEATAIPIARTMVPKLAVAGGIHIRLHPARTDHLLLEFFDSQGINISKAQEKKIEGAYFKEDLRRVTIPEVGRISVPSSNDVIETYSHTFETHIDVEAVRNSHSKVAIDYAYAVSGAVLPQLLAKFGCDAVVLNASLRPHALSEAEREDLLEQLGHVVEALKASFGVQVAANGEQLIVVDEAGIPIRGEQLTALMVSMMLTAQPRSTVVVPVHASSAVDIIARRHDASVLRTRANPAALMEAVRQTSNAVLGGSGDLGFIFPQLHPGFDAMFCIAKLIETLAVQQRSLVQARAELPRVNHKSYTMRCPWTAKGALMRHLVETHPPDRIELQDGVKILVPGTDNWVLVLPDAGEPQVHLFANSDDRAWTARMLREYRQRVQEFIDREHESTAALV